MTSVRHPVERFCVLALRRGLSLGVLHSSNRDDFVLLLAAAAAAFRPDRTYSEREVNDILRAWLSTAGTMLDVDHVELRRWLVDNRLLDRDGFGRAYAAGHPAPEMAAVIAALSGVDLGQAAEAARTSDARMREQRKRLWLERANAGAAPSDGAQDETPGTFSG
ncbi:MAG: DUF2087 domain-containing protein [Betaproteobacteria bacterium]